MSGPTEMHPPPGPPPPARQSPGTPGAGAPPTGKPTAATLAGAVTLGLLAVVVVLVEYVLLDYFRHIREWNPFDWVIGGPELLSVCLLVAGAVTASLRKLPGAILLAAGGGLLVLVNAVFAMYQLSWLARGSGITALLGPENAFMVGKVVLGAVTGVLAVLPPTFRYLRGRRR